jgi:hypothetical protein
MAVKFQAHIKNGKLVVKNRMKFDAYISGLRDGGIWDVIIKRPEKIRTDPQNRYYFGVVVKILADELGYTKDELHEALKWKFLQVPGPLPTVKSTAKLSTVEFIDYIDEVVRWAAQDLGVVLPDPEETE